MKADLSPFNKEQIDMRSIHVLLMLLNFFASLTRRAEMTLFKARALCKKKHTHVHHDNNNDDDSDDGIYQAQTDT
jgi:hypothetical protein